ncbi:hypothetical protein [Actinomadura gamaensis]|uniref:Uncharacterized protein n=1 Tax=Actinomadura gamaensis TaxID=1763541 RepID=A0ABV9U679_9ACTN
MAAVLAVLLVRRIVAWIRIHALLTGRAYAPPTLRFRSPALRRWLRAYERGLARQGRPGEPMVQVNSEDPESTEPRRLSSGPGRFVGAGAPVVASFIAISVDKADGKADLIPFTGGGLLDAIEAALRRLGSADLSTHGIGDLQIDRIVGATAEELARQAPAASARNGSSARVFPNGSGAVEPSRNGSSRNGSSRNGAGRNGSSRNGDSAHNGSWRDGSAQMRAFGAADGEDAAVLEEREAFRRLADAASGGSPRRPHLRARVETWSGEVVASVFVNVALEGRSLRLGMRPFVLEPVLDELDRAALPAVRPGAVAAVRYAAGALLNALAEACLDLWTVAVGGPRGLSRARPDAKRLVSRRRKRLVRRLLSVRELCARRDGSSMNQEDDYGRQITVIRERVLGTTEDFLDAHHVDLTEYRAQARLIIMNSVIVGGHQFGQVQNIQGQANTATAQSGGTGANGGAAADGGAAANGATGADGGSGGPATQGGAS